MTRGNSSTAPLEALRLFTLTSTGRRAVSLSGSTRNTHQYWNHAHIGRMKQVHTTKTNFNETCLASVLSSFQNSLKQSKIKKIKNSRGYENKQLSAGDESCLQVHFTGYHHGTERSMVRQAPSLFGFFCYMLRKKRPGLFTSLLSGQNPGETEYRRFERQLINIRQSQTTQLLLHNCPIK